jgi:hypothetical protein
MDSKYMSNCESERCHMRLQASTTTLASPSYSQKEVHIDSEMDAALGAGEDVM